jgi:hypothetical protein
MKAGFAHFDGSHRENFCAAVLLLAMEVDEAVKRLLVGLVCKELDLDPESPLLSFGREARLSETDDDDYARVDLWLLFNSTTGPVYAFIEVKTHDRWDARHVAHQVRDQAERRVARSGTRRVHGSVLLAPERLCRRVRAVDGGVRFTTWPELLADLHRLRSTSPLTERAIQHLEETMDQPAGLDRAMTLNQFEEATTTIACLRQFLVDCIGDLEGQVQGQSLYTTPANGQPRRGGGWAWHGLAVPFSEGKQRGRVGIYKYAEAPAGEESARETLWLEAYLGDDDTPVAFVKFAPAALSAKELDAMRAALRTDWKQRTAVPGEV